MAMSKLLRTGLNAGESAPMAVVGGVLPVGGFDALAVLQCLSRPGRRVPHDPVTRLRKAARLRRAVASAISVPAVIRAVAARPVVELLHRGHPRSV